MRPSPRHSPLSPNAHKLTPQLPFSRPWLDELRKRHERARRLRARSTFEGLDAVLKRLPPKIIEIDGDVGVRLGAAVADERVAAAATR